MGFGISRLEEQARTHAFWILVTALPTEQYVVFTRYAMELPLDDYLEYNIIYCNGA
jgi:hypothetical protein